MKTAALPVRVIDGDTVSSLLAMNVCIDLMRNVMTEVSHRRTQLPLRWGLPMEHGVMGMMPGSISDPACFGIKLVSLFPGNTAAGLSSHMGLVVLFEANQGRPLALLNGADVTRIRTAAASAVATAALAPATGGRLAVLGTGEQAQAHLEAMCCVRSFDEVVVWGRDFSKASNLASSFAPPNACPVTAVPDAREAVAKSSVICTTTASEDTILPGAWLEAGMHLNVVGSSVASMVEIDSEAVVRSRYFVDYIDSALDQAGELRRAMQSGSVTQSHIRAEIGEVLMGRHPGRTAPEEITLYRSLGIIAQDLAAAWYVYQEAERLDLGTKATI